MARRRRLLCKDCRVQRRNSDERINGTVSVTLRLRRGGGEDIDGDGAPLQWFRGVSFSLACKSRR